MTLLIEKMAIHLQDPFENKPTDTPMTTIARSILKNLLQKYQLQKPDTKQHPDFLGYGLGLYAAKRQSDGINVSSSPKEEPQVYFQINGRSVYYVL